MKSVFVVIDGMDGSGKTKLISQLHHSLFSSTKEWSIMTTREPTSGTYGQQIRTRLKEEHDPKKNAEIMLDLFIKDRAEHTQELKRILAKDNTLVLCDRYYYSTIAFQHAQGIDLPKLIDANKEFPQPDIAFILDLDPQQALERIKGRAQEKFEQLEFMQTLRQNFLSLPDHLEDNIIIVDATKSSQEVCEEVLKHLEPLLLGK